MFPNAQFICGEEGGRVIGKVPPLPPGCVEIDILRGSILEEWPAMTAKRTRK